MNGIWIGFVIGLGATLLVVFIIWLIYWEFTNNPICFLVDGMVLRDI